MSASTPIPPMIVLTDLDDTLFSSIRKQGGRSAPAEASTLEVAATLRDGRPISYTSSIQRAFIGWLRRADLVVPVTARTTEAFKRVNIRFDGGAVVEHGATILRADHTSCPVWAARVNAALANEWAPLEALHAQMRSALGPQYSVRLAGDGRPVYLMVKHLDGDEAAIRGAFETLVRPWADHHPGYHLHINGNNLAVMPPSISKRAAVAWLICDLRLAHPGACFVGAGDSSTDWSFMDLCDFAIVPQGSQISDVLGAVLHG